MLALYILAYLIIVGFLLIERFLRSGSKDMKAKNSDKGSTMLVSVVMGVAFVLSILAPLLNWLKIGSIPWLWVGIVGVALGMGGLFIRQSAFRTLGRFFTRTLKEERGHKLVTNGIYRYVRHPGYLSDILIFLGIMLALRNWIAAAYVLVVFSIVYTYRIHAEEQMLIGIFGDEYVRYRKRSKKLIPFVY